MNDSCHDDLHKDGTELRDKIHKASAEFREKFQKDGCGGTLCGNTTGVHETVQRENSSETFREREVDYRKDVQKEFREARTALHRDAENFREEMPPRAKKKRASMV